MLPVLSALQAQRWFIRWPLKQAIFATIVFFTLYPNLNTFRRHLQHIGHAEGLTDPQDPALGPFRAEFDQYAQHRHLDVAQPKARMQAVESFVYARIPYAWDWDTWSVADYLPTLSELAAKGREDCDGRAVLAAALLRSFSVPAQLVADPRHVWVHTPDGDLMNPLGRPVFQTGPDGLKIRWRALLDPGPFAFGVAVFPLIRELIILLAAWCLLLPPRTSRGGAALVLLLLVESLIVMRFSGANPVAPHYLGLTWAAVHWPIALWILLRYRSREIAPATGPT